MQARTVELNSAEREQLQARVRRATSPMRDVLRAGIVLDAAAGLSNEAIAAARKTRPATVSKWRGRFLAARLEGLGDAPRSGQPARYDQTTERRILQQLDTPAPAGYARWNGSLLAAALPDISADQIWRVLRRHGISLQRRRSWGVSTDPCFAQKAADVVGLYLNPPDHAIVLSVDEKSQIQALDRTQPVLPMGLGYVEGITHDYVRHGTTTLFAALDIASGTVFTECKPRHRHQEFLAFLKRIDEVVPEDLTVHLIVDNYATHKHAKVRLWLAQRTRFQIHYTPTYSSWLNQVERWFGLITQQAIRRGSFRSVKDLIAKIDHFVRHYNRSCRPFAWTATADSILNKLARLCSRISGTEH